MTEARQKAWIAKILIRAFQEREREMTDQPAERMGGDSHAHRTAQYETRAHIWLIHQRLVEMGALPMWNVYRPPFNDYPPDAYVAQLCRTRPEVERLPYVFWDEDLDRLRLNMPPTCCNVGRAPDDHPQIVEVWV